MLETLYNYTSLLMMSDLIRTKNRIIYDAPYPVSFTQR